MIKIVKTQVEFEGRFYDQEVVVEDERLRPWGPGEEFRLVGKSTPRVDGFAKVSGKGHYTCDIQLPGMLYGKILRSPHPHARIGRVDVRRAEALAGVRAVLTLENVPRAPWQNDSFLLDEVVRYQGDEVAVVAAEDEDIARDAIDLIEVEYETLPFVIDPEEAMKPNAPRVRPGGNVIGDQQNSIYQRGNIEGGFDEADVTLERKYHTQTAVHHCFETHGAVATWEGDSLTIWESTQHVYGVRNEVARALGLPLHKVRVIAEFVGGGFGSKQETGKYSVFAALLAKRTGRPVRIMLDRYEEGLAGGNREATIQHLKGGVKKDGTLTALYLRSVSNIGAYGYGPMETVGPVRELYRCKNVKTESYAVYTNADPSRPFRGPGYVEGMFALESLIDELAGEIGMDPLEFRLRNYASRDPATGKEYSYKLLREAYLEAAERIEWRDRANRRGAGSKRRGIGMGTQLWGGGGMPPAYAIARWNVDGTAIVLTGSQDIGTGARTSLALIAAEEFGIPLEDLDLVVGDSEAGPYAPVSAGSMTVSSVGPAVRAAAHDAKRQLLEVASSLLGAPVDQLRLTDGQVFSSSAPNKRLPVKEITKKLGNFVIIGKGSRGPNPRNVKVRTFGTQFAEVEVDIDTGEVTILRMVAVHECGRIINPLTVSNQLEGGVVQGLGYGLMEERVMDRATGKVLNPNLEAYKIPTALDVGTVDAGVLDIPDVAANTVGVKGIGEPPLIPTAPAVANAIFDATGIRLRDLPLTQASLLNQMRRAPGTTPVPRAGTGRGAGK